MEEGVKILFSDESRFACSPPFVGRGFAEIIEDITAATFIMVWGGLFASS